MKEKVEEDLETIEAKSLSLSAPDAKLAPGAMEILEDIDFADTKEPDKEEPLVEAPPESAGPLKETVVHINRVTKVVSGGKRFAFSAILVVGDGKGKLGIGKGKARDVQMAIAKAGYQAKKKMIAIRLVGTTIPCAVIGTFGAARVLMKPAAEGTGVVAGGAIRAALEACGIKDILTKNLGTSNPYNVLYAVVNGLSRLRTKEEFAKIRGKRVEDL